jgi:pescadillo protein
VPHSFTQNTPEDVDFRVMGTFVEFYQVMLDFVLFKLFTAANLPYPRKIQGGGGIREMLRAKDEGVGEAIGEDIGEKDKSKKSKKATDNTIVIPSSVTMGGDEDDDEEVRSRASTGKTLLANAVHYTPPPN